MRCLIPIVGKSLHLAGTAKNTNTQSSSPAKVSARSFLLSQKILDNLTSRNITKKRLRKPRKDTRKNFKKMKLISLEVIATKGTMITLLRRQKELK